MICGDKNTIGDLYKMRKKPITTLFMLESLDGKISSGNTDELDADKD